ncbi:hypothetical protein BCR34DRAFT_599775 [Clohesyomyces aquaticus]|uniref:Uncharacterized protein n=1 Tax=Clohesyomyces aquaticus TaxID=1231657 RepID=A0A1Y1ZTQ8_9PLEO|nr:hypothetical protein BCR34DRAFT_599775 [Clohesyomyces aquaticus]
MRFSSAITTALLGAAALTTSVVANPIENAQLTLRDTIDEKIGGSASAWDGYAAFCGGQNTKRGLNGLYKRKPDPPIPGAALEITVGGQDGIAEIPIGYWTWDLVTCIGVVVTGNKKGSKDTLALLDKLELEKDGSDCFMSVPDREDQVPPTWNDEKKQLAKKIEDKLQDALNKIVDGDCKKTPRFMYPVYGDDGVKNANYNDINGIMSVDGNNEVRIAGNKVS